MLHRSSEIHTSRQAELGNKCRADLKTKKAVPRLWNGLLAKSSGEEGKLVYIDGGAGLALCCCVPPAVFVINRTFTRRFAARPSRVLFSSTGLSLPNPTI